ncbi:MAG: radical SAM protein [Paracoccaceae bacterium]|nr:radical SAM protein [Paracoccaceae bacterium]
MKVSVHLVSTPWADPRIAPIQTACLKAWLATHTPDVPVYTYAPFMEVLIGLKGGDYLDFVGHIPEQAREFVSLFAYLRRYAGAAMTEREVRAVEHVIANMVSPKSMTSFEKANRASGNLRQKLAGELNRHFADAFAAEITDYVDRELRPKLSRTQVNVVGFTLNYHQNYAAALMVKHLLEREPDGRFLFLFGGGSASHPAVRRAFSFLGLPGYVVFGEGESKLQRVVELAGSCEDMASLHQALDEQVSGVLAVDDQRDTDQDNLDYVREQITELDTLPAPDYADYFDALRRVVQDEEAFVLLRGLSHITVEGTRGCFAKCDFCALNRQWSGFRKKSAAKVSSDALALRQRYRVNFMHFADNVCDTWAEDYAQALIDQGIKVPGLMELRSHHPEAFWGKLALAGINEIQIGVEAVSPHLLRAMNKGTRVFQNLRAMKYLAELGILWAPISNIITHHPRSTLEDVVETRRIVRASRHWGSPNLSVFHLDPGSPLFETLSGSERARLRPLVPEGWPEGLSDYLVSRHVTVPETWRDGAVSAAWDEFTMWYEDFRVSSQAHVTDIWEVENGADGLWLRVSEEGGVRNHYFDRDTGRLYALCHHTAGVERLVARTGLPETCVRERIGELEERGLILRTEDRYVSTALRDRDRLIRPLLCSQNAKFAHEIPAE